MTGRLGILATHPVQYQVPWFRALVKAGVDVTVFYCQIPDAVQQGDGFGIAFQWDISLLDGYPYEVLKNVARCPSLTRFGGCDTPDIGGIVRSGRFDAFIVNGWVVKSCLQLLTACRMSGIPCLVRGESNSIRRRRQIVRWMHRLLLTQYAAVLSIGEKNREFYLANGVPERKIFATPYCVDNLRFESEAARCRGERNIYRARWGVSPDACVFLFSGKLIGKKRPRDVIEGLSHCMRSCIPGRSVHLLVVGDGELMDECRGLASMRGLPVSFAGFMNQSEMPAAYACADCLVLPSDDGETWGLVVNEAMACGLPAIVSDHVGCQADLVQEGQTGYVFPLGDVQAMGRAMACLVNDPIVRRRLGCQARDRIQAYTYDHVVEGTVNALRSVLGRNPREKMP